ncbi:MAG: MauE/DoxX family redox-associated membrane protein [Pseudomonadales bacterium]|nr:MauE/DoxX family redox-associated membrane protein [Pseudomonadales bacterium]MDP6470496.1 MauE/DoxX family redox-associated membrane protein [Pseudomonadales bacterium]MDP6827798.1 MauE/DoxX family redox-associated membrane protein [Pseudomonadales bacterium]MDP6972970.1 MauE/DoxX family redox-associated membrane protein [Pseudomonadales bacterium]
MTEVSISSIAAMAAAWSLAGILLAAALHKYRDLDEFSTALAAYRLLPTWSIAIIARTLVLLETAIACTLFAPPSAPSAAIACAVLLITYTLAIVVNLARGRSSIDCGCGGEPTPISVWMVLRNALLVILAGVATLPVSRFELTTVLFAAATALTVWMLYALANQLLTNQGMFRERFGVGGG